MQIFRNKQSDPVPTTTSSDVSSTTPAISTRNMITQGTQTASTGPGSGATLNPCASIFVPTSRLSLRSAPGEIEGNRPTAMPQQQL